jgi:seryl-tRNA synthetase
MAETETTSKDWRKRLKLVNTIFLGVVSLLVAYSTFQAAQVGERSQNLEDSANRMLMQSLEDAQQSNTEFTTDAVASMILSQVEAAGGSETLKEHIRSTFISQEWTQGELRSEARLAKALQDCLDEHPNAAADDADVCKDEKDAVSVNEITMDDTYWTSLNAEGTETLFEVGNMSDAARLENQNSARLSGSAVIYAAALLLLTIVGTSRQARVALILMPSAAFIVAIGIWSGLPQ